MTHSLRHTLVMAHKETAFKKVVQATMIRDRQHGPILELNRMFSSQVRKHFMTFMLFNFLKQLGC